MIPYELRGLTIQRVIRNPRPSLKDRIWRHQVKIKQLSSNLLQAYMESVKSCSVSKGTFDLTVTRGTLWFDKV